MDIQEWITDSLNKLETLLETNDNTAFNRLLVAQAISYLNYLKRCYNSWHKHYKTYKIMCSSECVYPVFEPHSINLPHIIEHELNFNTYNVFIPKCEAMLNLIKQKIIFDYPSTSCFVPYDSLHKPSIRSSSPPPPLGIPPALPEYAYFDCYQGNKDCQPELRCSTCQNIIIAQASETPSYPAEEPPPAIANPDEKYFSIPSSEGFCLDGNLACSEKHRCGTCISSLPNTYSTYPPGNNRSEPFYQVGGSFNVGQLPSQRKRSSRRRPTHHRRIQPTCSCTPYNTCKLCQQAIAMAQQYDAPTTPESKWTEQQSYQSHSFDTRYNNAPDNYWLCTTCHQHTQTNPCEGCQIWLDAAMTSL